MRFSLPSIPSIQRLLGSSSSIGTSVFNKTDAFQTTAKHDQHKHIYYRIHSPGYPGTSARRELGPCWLYRLIKIWCGQVVGCVWKTLWMRIVSGTNSICIYLREDSRRFLSNFCCFERRGVMLHDWRWMSAFYISEKHSRIRYEKQQVLTISVENSIDRCRDLQLLPFSDFNLPLFIGRNYQVTFPPLQNTWKMHPTIRKYLITCYI